MTMTQPTYPGIPDTTRDLIAQLVASAGVAGTGYGTLKLAQRGGFPALTGATGGLSSTLGRVGSAAGALGSRATSSGILDPILQRGGYAALGEGVAGPTLARPLLQGGRLATGLKGAGLGLVGDFASYGIGKAIPGSSTAEHVLSGGAKGAGIGAGLGLLGGPFAGLSVPAGAAIGGALGGLGGLIFGGKKEDKASTGTMTPGQRLRSVLQSSGIPTTTSSQIMGYYKALAELNGGSIEAKAQALAQVQPLVLEALQGSGTNQFASGQLTPTQNAAIQAQTAQFLSPYVQQTIDSAQQNADYTMKYLPSVPEAYRGVLAAGAQAELSASTRLANAYAAQAQLAPGMAALQQAQQAQQSLASQLLQQAISSQIYGPQQQSGEEDLTALMSQYQ